MASLVLSFDGGSRGNPGPGGSGSVLYQFLGHEKDGTSQKIWERALYLPDPKTTNNVAEYLGLVEGLEKCVGLVPTYEFVTCLKIRGDSKLCIQQIQGNWQVRAPNLVPYHTRATQALRTLTEDLHIPVTYTWVPRAQNKEADALANRAMDNQETFEWTNKKKF